MALPDFKSWFEALLQTLSGEHGAPIIPLSFDGSRVNYAWVLFSLMITVSFVATALLGSLKTAWDQRKLWTWRDPIMANRYILWCFCIGVMVGATPDLVTLYAYGEVSPGTLGMLLQIDRAMDSLVMFPVIAAVGLWYRAKPVINYQLIRQPIPVELWPTFRQMFPYIRIGLITAVIALGVAIGK